MSEPFLKANDRPITLEAAKLHAVLVEVDRFVADVHSLRNAIRGDVDRQEAATAAQPTYGRSRPFEAKAP
jgi:hypothetical protein